MILALRSLLQRISPKMEQLPSDEWEMYMLIVRDTCGKPDQCVKLSTVSSMKIWWPLRPLQKSRAPIIFFPGG
jgi:hypothetical protein